jgi:hypothetical protein
MRSLTKGRTAGRRAQHERRGKFSLQHPYNYEMINNGLSRIQPNLRKTSRTIPIPFSMAASSTA